MNWADERYVRLYVRDTPSWKLLPWQSKALLPLLLRKLDRVGCIELGEEGLDALAAFVELPVEVVEAGLPALLKRGTFAWSGQSLVMPKYLDAQEVPISDAQRKREQRERDRAKLLETAQVSRAVTSGHASHVSVTPNHAVPSRAVPAVPSRAVPDVTEEKSRALYAWMQQERAKRLHAMEQFPIPGDLRAWYARAIEAVKGDDGKLRSAWLGYLDDTWAKSLKPACPWSAWVKDGKWTGYVTATTRPRTMRPMKPGESDADYEKALAAFKASEGGVTHG